MLGGYVSAEYGDTVLYAILAALVLAWPRAARLRIGGERMNGLVASSRRSAQRSALVASRVPRGLTPTAVVAVVGVLFVLVWGQQYTGSVFVLAACYAIVTAGMAVQIGFSQQIAFSQSVFMGVGAYGVAMLNTHYNLPVLLATPIVLVGSALLAILLGSVVTRASGLALAVATLMLPLIAVGYVSGTGFLGGAVGAPLPGTLWPSSSASTTVALVGGGLIVIALLALAVFIAARGSSPPTSGSSCSCWAWTSGRRPRSESAPRAGSWSCSCSAACSPPSAARSTRAPSSSCRRRWSTRRPSSRC